MTPGHESFPPVLPDLYFVASTTSSRKTALTTCRFSDRIASQLVLASVTVFSKEIRPSEAIFSGLIDGHQVGRMVDGCLNGS